MPATSSKEIERKDTSLLQVIHHNMASRFPTENKVQLRTRKGQDRTWSCDKHDEPISFYCRKDKVTICQKCAIKDHCQKPCKLDDIEDVISERKRKLDETQKKIDETKKRLNRHASKIGSSETSASNHLQSVNDEVNATYDEKLKSLKGKKRDEIRLINEEADEEIQIINEKRETRIKACKEEAEKQQQISKDIQAKLLSEIKKIDMTVRKQIDDLKSINQHEISTMDNVDSRIERIKQNDKTLVNEAPQVIASLDESLSSNVHQEVADYLERIERAVQRVKFVEGEVGGEHCGRIDGYIGKWELVKSINIPSVVNEPWVRGLISDDEICMSDYSDNALYVTNIITESTHKVIARKPGMYVTSCAPVDSDVILCGKWRRDCTGYSLDGCITLYDRQWKVIRDITIPKNISSLLNTETVCVDVDRDGMILAAQKGQSNIYVINPADGKIVNTITMKDLVRGRIQALSSGDIVMTDINKFAVNSRSGEGKAVIHRDEWEWSRCYVDKLTDTLYITYEDRERDVCAVDQVSCDGKIQARRIVEYVKSDHSLYMSPCLITPSGNLVGCNGDKFFVYKKRFIV